MALVGPTPHILLADDQADVLEALALLLKHAGHRTTTVASPAAIVAAVRQHRFDAVLMDLNYARDTTSGSEGFDLLTRIHELDATLPVVVMTAWGSLEGAVEAMRRGARDYIQKPWDNQRLLQILRVQTDLAAALRQKRRLEGVTARQAATQLPQLIARSAAMVSVVRLAERVAASDAPVLITGEHGTGKEVIARWLHAHSQRANQPFVAINAGGISEGVFESELFGHVKGAFTDARTDRAGCFELADGGTLFLDEIGNMPLSQQAKLLRVLQTGEFNPVGSTPGKHADVRFLSATNMDVAKDVAERRFRADLLYRINTVELHLPPLRERREDIVPLATHFAANFSARYGRPEPRFSAAAANALLDHQWPGNVRELEHVVQRALLLAQTEVIDAADLLLDTRPHQSPEMTDMTLDQAEKHVIQRALARAGGHVSEAARQLGISRSALYRRLQQHGIKTTE
jgi:DNA-binding NtrC family response regulator